MKKTTECLFLIFTNANANIFLIFANANSKKTCEYSHLRMRIFGPSLLQTLPVQPLCKQTEGCGCCPDSRAISNMLEFNKRHSLLPSSHHFAGCMNCGPQSPQQLLLVYHPLKCLSSVHSKPLTYNIYSQLLGLLLTRCISYCISFLI